MVHYRDYVIRADNVTYNRTTTELEADGHLQVTGGPNDVLINATHGDMRLNMHTARFYNVNGSQGVRTMGHTVVYSTPNPLLFSGPGAARDRRGQLPDRRRLDDQLPAAASRLADHRALHQPGQQERIDVERVLRVSRASRSSIFPICTTRPTKTGRVSGLLTPVISNGSSIRGYTFGEQVYWAINRSMDMVVGTEYFSKRGWAPNGDFRYKGPGLTT